MQPNLPYRASWALCFVPTYIQDMVTSSHISLTLLSNSLLPGGQNLNMWYHFEIWSSYNFLAGTHQNQSTTFCFLNYKNIDLDSAFIPFGLKIFEVFYTFFLALYRIISFCFIYGSSKSIQYFLFYYNILTLVPEIFGS